MCAHEARPLARPDTHPPGHDSAKPTEASQGSLPARRGWRHSGCFPCEQPLEAHRSPVFNSIHLENRLQKSYKAFTWQANVRYQKYEKAKRNALSLPWRSKAWAIITQQSGQVRADLNPRNHKPIAGPTVDHLQEIKYWKASAQKEHWKQERRQGGNPSKWFPTQNSKLSQTSHQLDGWDKDIFCIQVLKTCISFVLSQSQRMCYLNAEGLTKKESSNRGKIWKWRTQNKHKKTINHHEYSQGEEMRASSFRLLTFSWPHFQHRSSNGGQKGQMTMQMSKGTAGPGKQADKTRTGGWGLQEGWLQRKEKKRKKERSVGLICLTFIKKRFPEMLES